MATMPQEVVMKEIQREGVNFLRTLEGVSENDSEGTEGQTDLKVFRK